MIQNNVMAKEKDLDKVKMTYNWYTNPPKTTTAGHVALKLTTLIQIIYKNNLATNAKQPSPTR